MPARLATTHDASAIAAMLDAFNREFETPTPSREDLERRLARLLTLDDVIVVLAGDSEAFGFILVTLRPSPYYEGPIASVDETYVVPERRGQGIGGSMMRLLLSTVRDRGCGEVQINVDEGDDGARRFYESHGFFNHEPGSDERMLCYIQEI